MTQKNDKRKKVSSQRLKVLISLAQQHSKAWLAVDVVEALQTLQRVEQNGRARGGVSPQRLQTLIAYAQQCSKHWLTVDVVAALQELQQLLAVNP